MKSKRTGDISTLDGTSLKMVDKFTYIGSSVSSTEKDIDTQLTKAWTAIDRLSIIWKSELTDKMKRTNYKATCLPSRKISKLDEPDMQDTAGEAGTRLYVMYSYGPPHMAGQK